MILEHYLFNIKKKDLHLGTSKNKIKSCLEMIYIIKFTLTLKTNENVLLYFYTCIKFLSYIYHDIITFLYDLLGKMIFLNLKKVYIINIIKLM